MNPTPQTRVQLRWSECVLCDERVECPQLNGGQPVSVAMTKDHFGWRPSTGWPTGIPWLGRRDYTSIPLSALRGVDIELGDAHCDTRIAIRLESENSPGGILGFSRPWRAAFAWIQTFRRLRIQVSGLTPENDPLTLRGYLTWVSPWIKILVVWLAPLVASLLLAPVLDPQRRAAAFLIALVVGLAMSTLVATWQFYRSNYPPT